MITLNPSEETWQISKVNPPGSQPSQDVCLLGCYPTCFSRFSGLSDSTINCQQLPTLKLLDQKIHPLLLQELLIAISVALVFVMVIFKDTSFKQEGARSHCASSGYDIIAMAESWWDESHNWSAALNGYKLLKRDRHGSKSVCVWGGYPLCKKMELKNSDEQVESLWKKLGAKPTKETLCLVFTAGCPTKGSLLMKCSYFSYRKHHGPRL